MILVDTSVWVQHLRAGNEALSRLLRDEMVFCHPFVVGELACGSLKNRTEILARLQALPSARLAQEDEVLTLVNTRRLYGAGLGWIDVHLLASALLTPARLWTIDRALASAASALEVAARD